MGANQVTSRKQLEQAVLTRADSDESFRRSLLVDPRGTLAKDFGITIPPSVKINVLEESSSNLYLVLPARSAANSGELADSELEAVAGGRLANEANDAGKFSKPTSR